MFDDDGARRSVVIANRVEHLLQRFAALGHHAMGDEHVIEYLRFAQGLGVHANAEIGGVGEQTALTGLHGIEQAFAGEGVVFENGEVAAIERVVAGIGEPHGAQRARRAERRVPQRNFFGDYVRLQNGDQRRFIFLQRHRLLEFVLEEIAEFPTLRFGRTAVGYLTCDEVAARAGIVDAAEVPPPMPPREAPAYAHAAVLSLRSRSFGRSPQRDLPLDRLRPRCRPSP